MRELHLLVELVSVEAFGSEFQQLQRNQGRSTHRKTGVLAAGRRSSPWLVGCRLAVRLARFVQLEMLRRFRPPELVTHLEGFFLPAHSFGKIAGFGIRSGQGINGIE